VAVDVSLEFLHFFLEHCILAQQTSTLLFQFFERIAHPLVRAATALSAAVEQRKNQQISNSTQSTVYAGTRMQLNRVPASAAVRAGMLPLPGGR